MSEITVLFPGGFKPLTGAHMALAQRYAELSDVERVILLIGPKERDGITREKSAELFNLLNTNSKITMQPTEFNSPIMAAYEYLFALPEDVAGQYAMAASTKGDDYVRTKSFVPNVDKYKVTGDKKGRMIPQGVDAIELNVDVDPLLYSNGQPISASTIRAAIADKDTETIKQSYPGTPENILNNIVQILMGLQEGAMGTKNYEKHRDKMDSLRTFLDANIGKEFEYDFDKFSKTIFGAQILESKATKQLTENYITRQELASIEPVVDGFFRKYGIDVDFQGQFTHFIERLNDPRNEGTITLDDLENLFRDLADEYGEDIVNQIQQKQPTAVASDFQFDVPLHMPFQLQFDPSKGLIELVPRTIKAQRRRWQSNNPKDKLYTIENVITEGGAAGHMSHPYDSQGLTFGDMKEIVSRALGGYLDIEEAVTEKTDGQNIQITWKDGQIGFARNKGTVITPMTIDELISKFEGRGPISNAFSSAAEDLSEALQQLPPERLNGIFKNGRVFANMEIIYPETANVIAYETAVLQFHNLVEYDEKGNVVETDLTGGKLLQQAVQEANAHLQKTFKIIPPQQIKLGRVADFEDQQAAFFNEIDQLKDHYDLQDSDVVTEYHKKWWADVIREKAQQMQYNIPEDILNILIYRWAFSDKSTSLTKLKKMIDNPQFLEWVLAFDKKDFKTYWKQNIQPFESIFLRLGAVILKNATNFLAVNPNDAVQKIRQEMASLIRELEQSTDPNTLSKLKTELARIQRLGGFDAIVPTEGIVFVYGGNTYKLTGAFAPVNQILGVLKYSR
tara:strand:- start:4007 stop:6385 length:2379 start_codon:yes stop_codon:yes gene_type:complete